MASPQPTGSIRLNIVDGTRQAIAAGKSVLVTGFDGNNRQVLSRWFRGPVVTVVGLPFHNSPQDLFRLIVHVDGYKDGGIFPLRLQAARLIDAYVMLIPEDGAFHFLPFKDAQIGQAIRQLLVNGADGDPAARYSTAVEDRPMELGALLTIGTAVRDMPLDHGGNPLDFYWEVIWDLLMPDRFFAWVDARLVARVAALALPQAEVDQKNRVAEEKNPGELHPGVPGRIDPATHSWKQVRFNFANVQLTFHETTRSTIRQPNGTDLPCVVVEPDMDYYKDLLAHGLLEVLPNWLTHGKTDPRAIYSLRWTAAKLDGTEPAFEPPVTVE